MLPAGDWTEQMYKEVVAQTQRRNIWGKGPYVSTIPFYRSEDRGAGVSSGVKSSSINTIIYKDGLGISMSML